MRTGTLLQLWLLSVIVGVPLAAGQTTSLNDSRRLEALVNELQSEDFEEREQASAAILEMGAVARPWIEKGAKSAPLELRRRCEQLLRRMDLAEFERQVLEYRHGSQLETLERLPCAKEFRGLFGGDEAARELYCDALMSDRALLQALADFLSAARSVNPNMPETERRARLSLKAQPMQDLLSDISASEYEPAMIYSPSGDRVAHWPGFRAETLSLCALIGAQTELAEEQGLQNLLFGFFRDANLHKARKSKHLPTLRIGAAKWLSQFESKPQSLSIAMRLGLGEIALKLGRKAIDSYSKENVGDFDNDGRDDLSQAALGIVACGKYGDESDIQRFAKFLDEPMLIRTWITEEQDTFTCELRDLALVYSAHLAKIDPKALGFPHLESSTETVFVTYSISFADEAQRNKAHANWRRLQVEVRQKASTIPSKSA